MFISDNSARALVLNLRNAHFQVLTQKAPSSQVQTIIHLNWMTVADKRVHLPEFVGEYIG